MTHVLTHGLFFAAVANGYLFLIMISTSPRVWGYSDYPKAIKDKVPAQTKKEKSLAAIIGLPWFVFVLGFPVWSTYALKSKLGGEIPFLTAFLNLIVMFVLATIGDLVILDRLIITRITPKFVIIPGSDAADYKDFSHHYKGHAKAAVIMALIALALAAVVSYL
jgi:hypothetical protein